MHYDQIYIDIANQIGLTIPPGFHNLTKSGGDSYIFPGTYKGTKVKLKISKDQYTSKLNVANEIRRFKDLDEIQGKSVIRVLFSGEYHDKYYDLPYLVLQEYNNDLNTRLALGKLTLRQSLLQIGSAAKELNFILKQYNLTHQDAKLTNLYPISESALLIGDLGYANNPDYSKYKNESFGTNLFSSYEQANGWVIPQNDVFALGVGLALCTIGLDIKEINKLKSPPIEDSSLKTFLSRIGFTMDDYLFKAKITHGSEKGFKDRINECKNITNLMLSHIGERPKLDEVSKSLNEIAIRFD